MYKRDRMLAEACSVCIAYLVRSSGGTFYTVKKAKENGVRIINIALDDNALTAEKIKR